MFARRCFYVRNSSQPFNRSQPFATVRNRRNVRRNRSQPFATVQQPRRATVRNRSQPFDRSGSQPYCYIAVSMVSSAALQKGSFLEVSNVSLLRFAWQAWHFVTFPDVFRNACRKSFCVAGAILLRRFQKMRCSFRGRSSTLDVSIVILRGRRSTLDVSCCVFFANRIVRAASSGDKVQIPWQAWHFVRCAEN